MITATAGLHSYDLPRAFRSGFADGSLGSTLRRQAVIRGDHSLTGASEPGSGRSRTERRSHTTYPARIENTQTIAAAYPATTSLG